MSIYSYNDPEGIGGQEVDVQATEAIAALPRNRTMFIQKLTDEDPLKPEFVHDLDTVDAVFKHFKPNVDVNFENEAGSDVTENLKFNNLGDFGKKGITAQSQFLQELDVKQQQYLKFIKQVKSVKPLKNLLGDKESKEAFINALRAAAQELESSSEA